MSEQNLSDEQRQQIADEFLAEYLRRVEAGEAVDRDEFLRLHPEVTDLLRAYFAGADSMQRLKTEISAAPSPRGDETIAPRGPTDSTMTPAGPFSILPRQFGRYRVEKLLGAGAMGAVYLAHDTQLARPVALKVPRLSGNEDSEIVSRLLREAKAAANLNHPNICRVYDAGVEAGTFYIAMEYIDGRLLSEFISPDRFQDERRCVNVARKLAAALAEAHAKGIVHRDIKPANIIVNARGEPILTDFGLARLTDQPRDGRATQSGMLIGSPAYMSLEQANGDVAKIGPKSDIYGLGVLLFELLTSRLPFQGSVLTILSQIAGKEPPAPSSLRPGLDPRLDFICQRMMAKQPDDRFASMTEVGQELQNWLKAAPLIVPPAAGAAPATGGLKPVSEEKVATKEGDTATPAEVAQQERGVQKLLDEQNYDAAIPLLVKLSELEGALFKDAAAWAKNTLPTARQKQQRLRERAAAALSKARTLMETYNYGEVAQMLDAIPAAARTEEVRQLLTLAGERFEDCLGLQQEIDTAIRGKTYERLLPLVKRFLKLKPDNSKMQRLAKNLSRNRADRAARAYKGTGNYFDVAGRLVEPKEVVAGLFFIVALVVGVSYGAKHLGKIPAAGDLLSSQPSQDSGAGRDGKAGAASEAPLDPSGNAASKSATPRTSWSWSFSRLQAGRVPESSGSGFDLALPKDTSPDGNLASMIHGNTIEFRGGQCVDVDGVGDFGSRQPFSLAVWVRARTNPGHHGALLAKISDLSTSAGYALEYNQGSFDLVLISDWNMPGGPGAIEAFTVKYYDPGVWHHVVASYDGSGKGMGVNLYVDGNLEPAEIRTDRLNGEIRTDQKVTFGSRWKSQYFDGWLAEPRIYASALTPVEVAREFQNTPKPDASGGSSMWPAAFTRNFITRPSGRFLTTWERQTGAVFWDTGGGLVKGSTFPKRPGEQLLCMDVSPDERWVATAFRNAQNRTTTIVLWDLTTGKIKHAVEGLAVDVNQLAWHPSGKLFATGASNGQASFWSLEGDRPFSWSPGVEHLAGISGLTFHPKVSSLVASSFDGNYKIWYLPDDIEAAQPPIGAPYTLGNYPYGALGAAYDTTGDHLMMRGTSTVDIWSFVDGPHIRLSVPGTAFAWAPDGKSFVTAGGSGMEMEAKRWDTESGKMIAQYRGGCTQPITAVSFCPTGRLLFTDGSEDPFIVWDVESGRQISDRGKALMPDWGPIAGDPAGSPKSGAPPAFVTAENTGREIQSGGQRPARVAVLQCHPAPISPTGLWTDIPEALHEATVYEPPRAGKATFRNVVEFEVLEGGTLALAAAWGSEPIDPAASTNDPDSVTEQQLVERGWKATDTITRVQSGGALDKQRIFVRQVKTGEKYRLATRNLTPPFVIIPLSSGSQP